MPDEATKYRSIGFADWVKLSECGYVDLLTAFNDWLKHIGLKS